MRMIGLGNQPGVPLHIIDTATTVDCSKDVGLRRSFRSLVGCIMAPYCCGHPLSSSDASDIASNLSSSSTTTAAASFSPWSVVTGTFFGYRRGRVSFCLQDDPRAAPLLLLEFAVPTAFLAREMQHGLLRISLEHCGNCVRGRPAAGSSLFAVPVWSMYCNGRRVGFAVRRRAGDGDLAMLRTMQSVSAGAGVLPAAESKGTCGGGGGGGDLMYLRARFERVIGSVDSETFHLINPVGSTGQELSIFLLRS